MQAAPSKPDPKVSSWVKPFWDAAREKRLIVQKCSDCGKHIFYPRMACPFCFSDNLDWVKASGKATIYSYTVVESNAPSPFLVDIPYVIAIVILEEGVRMLTNIVECDPDSIECDQAVEVTFVKRDEQFTMPMFKPVG